MQTSMNVLKTQQFVKMELVKILWVPIAASVMLVMKSMTLDGPAEILTSVLMNLFALVDNVGTRLAVFR